MKRFVIIVIVLLMAALPASAQTPESTTQMTLAKSQKFIARLQYLMGQQARTVLSEATGGSCYTARQVFAQTVIGDSHQVASHAAPIVVGGVNLIGTVVPNSDPNLVDSSATDAAILSQVATFWSALSKCSTPS